MESRRSIKASINQTKEWLLGTSILTTSFRLKDGNVNVIRKEPDVLFKKQTYKIYTSLFFGILLGTMALYDLRAVYYEYESEGIPARWHTGILYCHVGSIYILITGFIVANETGQEEVFKYAITSLVLNVGAFVLRLVYEIGFMDFIPVTYFPPEP